MHQFITGNNRRDIRYMLSDILNPSFLAIHQNNRLDNLYPLIPGSFDGLDSGAAGVGSGGSQPALLRLRVLEAGSKPNVGR